MLIEEIISALEADGGGVKLASFFNVPASQSAVRRQTTKATP
jgi:hypothetical protein